MDTLKYQWSKRKVHKSKGVNEMKKMISLCLCIPVVFSLLPLSVFASTTQDVICFEDGSYLTVQLEQKESRASGSVTGSKTYTYKASDGTSQWQAVLTGTFSYTGSSATCTASSCSVTIYKSDWYTISKSASKSGNKATGTATVGRKSLGVTVDQKTANMSLSCDANGNLS